MEYLFEVKRLVDDFKSTLERFNIKENEQIITIHYDFLAEIKIDGRWHLRYVHPAGIKDWTRYGWDKINQIIDYDMRNINHESK